MIRLLVRLPVRLLRRVRFTWHLTTDPACVRYRAPRARSARDAASRGYPCPECWSRPTTTLDSQALDRLTRALIRVDGLHQFYEGREGPVCLCGFNGSARRRTQTEHITNAVMVAFRTDAESGDSDRGSPARGEAGGDVGR